MRVLQHEWKRLRKSPLARNAGWMMAGRGVGVLLQAAYFVLLARLLGVVEYGVFVGAFAFTSLASPYSSLGSGIILLRYVSIERKAFAAYWGNVLISTLGMSGLLIAGLGCLAPRLLNPSSASLAILAAVSNCLFAPLTEQAGRVFQCFEKMRFTAGLNLLTNLLRTLAVIGMLLKLHHATALQWTVAFTLVSAIAATIAVGTVTFTFGNPKFSPSLVLKHGMEGFGYSLATCTMSVTNDVDKTILSHYGMNQANGIYTMAYRAVDIATIPISSIVEAMLPRLFKNGWAGLAPAAELSYRMLKRTVPIGVLMALGMFVMAPLAPRIVGPGFAESVAALRWLCLIPFFRSVHLMLGISLTGAGLQHYRTIAQFAAACLNFGLNLWLISRFGWYGAAWSSLVTDAALGVMYWGLLRALTRSASLIERHVG